MPDKKINNRTLANKDRVLYFISLLHKASLTTSNLNHHIGMFVRYLAYALAITNDDGIIGLFKIQLAKASEVIIVGSCIYFVGMTVGLISYFAAFYKRPWTINYTVDLPRPLGLLARRIHAFWNYVVTVGFTMYLVWMSVNYKKIGPAVVYSIFMALQLAGAVFSIYMLKITLPSDRIQALLNDDQEILIFCTYTAIMVIGQLAQAYEKSNVRTYLQVAVAVLNFYLLAYYIIRTKYWHPKMNSLVFRLQAALTVFSMMVVRQNLDASVSGTYIVGTIALFLLIRLSNNIIRLKTYIDGFDKRLDLRTRMYGLAAMDETLSSPEAKNKPPSEISMFFLGLTSRQKTSNKDKSMNNLCPSNDLNEYILKYITNDLKDLLSLKMAAFFFMKQPYRNFYFLKVIMNKLKPLMNSNLKQRAEYYHLKLMIEAKIESTYFLKAYESQTTVSLLSNLNHIAVVSNTENGKDYVDIYYPLQCKQLFLQFVDLTNKEVSIAKDIFTYILNARRENRDVKMHTLHAYNSKAMAAMMTTDDYLAFIQDVVPRPPQYYYPQLYSYYAGLKFDKLKAREALLLYKSRRSTWDIMKVNSRETKTEAFDVDTAVLQISLGTHAVGLIVDATPNSDVLLKADAVRKSVVGSNCNDLFIDYLSPKHKELMIAMKTMEKTVNLQKDFFILQYDKSLKEANISLKILPELSKDLLMIASIRLLQNKERFLALTDKHFNLLQAEDEFWDSIFRKKESDLTNMEVISERITSMARIISILKSFSDLMNKNHQETTITSQAFVDLTTRILDLNNQSCISYSVDQQSPFINHLKRSVIFLKIIQESYFGQSVCKFYFKIIDHRLVHSSKLRLLRLNYGMTDDMNSMTDSESLAVTGSFNRHQAITADRGVPMIVEFEDNLAKNRVDADDVVKEIKSVIGGLTNGQAEVFSGCWKDRLVELMDEIEKYTELVNIEQELKEQNANLEQVKLATVEIKKTKGSLVNEQPIAEIDHKDISLSSEEDSPTFSKVATDLNPSISIHNKGFFGNSKGFTETSSLAKSKHRRGESKNFNIKHNLKDVEAGSIADNRLRQPDILNSANIHNKSSKSARYDSKPSNIRTRLNQLDSKHTKYPKKVGKSMNTKDIVNLSLCRCSLQR